MLQFISLLVFVGLVFGQNNNKYLKTDYEWKFIDFDWPSEEVKEKYIKNGDYDHRKIIPIDVDRAQDGRTFVTLIRTKGVPATVNVVSDKSGPSGPLLSPYPSWEWYSNENCKGILNVYRVAIDKCNRIWILDTGSNDGRNVCPAKLLTFDLSTNKLVQELEIPDDVAQNKQGRGLLITPVIHYPAEDQKCEKPMIFIADVVGNGLVVTDTQRFKRFEGPIFEPVERDSHFKISGQEFYLPDGLFGLALSPIMKNNKRLLAFRPLASKSLYFAEISDIFNAADFNSLTYYEEKDIFPSQVSTMAFSNDGILFFHLAGNTANGCWNLHKELKPKNLGIAVKDEDRLQFASGLKIINQNDKEVLITMTNRLQKIYTGTQDFKSINFRVSVIPVEKAKKGTVCDVKNKL